jgi:hypothetical protein
MRSASNVELKKLEALSGGVKMKFAFEYLLEQLVVNSNETNLSKKKKQKQQKPVKFIMECPPDDKQLYTLFEIVANLFVNMDLPIMVSPSVHSISH